VRLLNRALSALLGLALVASGVWALTTSLAHATGLPGLPAAYPAVTGAIRYTAALLSAASLSSPVAQGVCAGLVLLGALLLAMEAHPWPPERVQLAQAGTVTWWADRAALERGLGRILVARTAARRARARLRPHKAVWHVTIDAEAAPQARQELAQHARAALARLGRVDGQDVLRVRLRHTRRVA